jgi:hypothetical protein
MFTTDWIDALPKPSKDKLALCHSVISKDSKPHLKKRWALEHCDSFVYMDVDWSGPDEPSYVFYFLEEKDKLMFAIKFS